METKPKVKLGDKIVCVTDKFSYFTKGKEYEVLESTYNSFKITDDYGDTLEVSITHYNNDFKIKEEKETEYKETNGKLFYELDFEFITQIAERMASNKGKYEPYNWQKPMEEKDFKELLQAVFRHSLEIVEGKFEDDGREFGHLEATACDVMMICYQLKKNRQKLKLMI